MDILDSTFDESKHHSMPGQREGGREGGRVRGSERELTNNKNRRLVNSLSLLPYLLDP